jgi:hypothetical protein
MAAPVAEGGAHNAGRSGLPIKSTTNGLTPKVDPLGNNIKKIRAALGGGTFGNHNSLVDLLSFWLAWASVPHRGGKQGKPQTCKYLFSRISTRCRYRFGVEGTKTLQEIFPDLLIDGRFLSTTLGVVGASLLRGTRTLADVRTKSCDCKVSSRALWFGMRSCHQAAAGSQR